MIFRKNDTAVTMMSLFRMVSICMITIFIFGVQGQQSPAYVIENSPGCINNSVTSLPSDYLIVLKFKTTVTVCTLSYVPNGEDYVAIAISYKDRISCGVDVVQKYTFICFTNAVTLSDAGVYTASLRTENISNTLYVMRPPTKPVIDLQGNLINQQQHSLTCTANSTSVPTTGLPVTYTWTVGGAAITDPRFTATGSGNGVLMINPVQKQDRGKRIQCTAREEKGVSSAASDETILDVMYPPIVSALTKQDIIEGGNLAVTCSVTPGNPGASTIFWTKVGVPGFKQEGPTLRLPGINRSSSGNYSCTAENNYNNNEKGTARQFMVVNVLYQPSIEEIPRVNVNESQRVALTRRISSNPLSNVYWYSGTELLKTQTSVDTAELILDKAVCTDTGNFTIVASNGIRNNATSVVELLVNCKPYPGSNNITLGITDVSGIEFSTTIIGYPQPQYELKYENGTKNSKMTEVLSQNAVNNITVRYNQSTVQQSDYGVYRLEVRNSFGTSTVFVNVIPQRKPNSPTNIEVTCEVKRAKVQWKSSFDGGARQSFTAIALNGQQEAGRSDVVEGTEEGVIHSVYVNNLQPSTFYIFYVSAKNIHGNKSSTTSSCTILKATDGTSNVAAIAGGAAAGGIGLAVVVIVLVLFVRRYSKHEKQTRKNHRLTENGEENESQVDDGLKENALYVSADIANDEKPGPSGMAVYAEVKKKSPGLSDNNANVYAEVKKTGPKVGEDKATNGAAKPKKGLFKKEKPKQKKDKKQKLPQEVPDVYENSEDIAMKQRADDVYSNTGENRPPKPEQRGYKNQDGLLYVEVQFDAKKDNGKSVIHGEEEKTDYATVEFPFPPPSQKSAEGEKKEK